MINLLKRKLGLGLAAICALALIGCGGGGGASGSNPATISGNVTKGPTSGATVCAFIANLDGSKGNALGCTTSKSDSTFTLTANYTGDVLLEASGGSYTDEATGLTVTLTDTLQAVVSVQVGKLSPVQLTPLTTMGLNQLKSNGTVNAANYKTALTALVASLKAKGVLPQNATVNLLEDAPIVAGSSKNAYGQALIGVARMMNAGTTLQNIVSTANNASTLATLATASSSVLTNAQAQLVLTGNTVASLSSSMALCSTDRDMAWSPLLGSMIYGNFVPSATVSYLPSVEYGMGTTYNSATDAPIGSMCHATQIAYSNILNPQIAWTGTPPIPPAYAPTAILGTSATIVDIAAMSSFLKTALNSTDIRCLSERTDYVYSDWGFALSPPTTTTTPVLRAASYYRLITETAVIPANVNGSLVAPACPVGDICAFVATPPIPGGPFGQTNGLCWAQQYKTENFVWRY